MTDQQIIEAYWHRDEAAIRETAAAYGSWPTTSWGTPGTPRSASATPGWEPGTASRPNAPGGWAFFWPG